MSETPTPEWFSDAALAKQKEIAARTARGEQVDLSLLLGVLEPRVPPTAEQLCFNCSSDARDEVGGEEHGGKRWCSLCLLRERHIEYAEDPDGW